MRNRIRLFGGKKTEIFHLDNQVGAIAFIPVLNVIYYLLTLVTARQRRFALFLETVLLLAIGSLLIRLSTGWLLGAVFAHVLTCIGIGIQQQLLDASPDSRKKLGYVILFSAVFVLAMLAIAFAGRNAQNKMQPVCQEALEALTQRDAERWQSCLHPTKAADELLTIRGIRASFVLYRKDDGVYMSARSLGEVNVQVILEALGGGGNSTTAGGQAKGITVAEAKEKLLAAIDQYFED